MLQRILMETVWGRAIFALTAAGILLRMIAILSYKRMKNAAENPSKTKQQWVLLLKKRYESYERFGRIKNVEAFVEHYFTRKGIMGIPLSVWDKSGMLLAVMAGFVGICGAAASYAGGESLRQMAGYLLVGGISAAGLLMLHICGDSTHTKRQILVALTDSLANGTSQRNGSQEKNVKDKPLTKEEVDALSEAAVTEEERMVLEEVLEDYFWK